MDRLRIRLANALMRLGVRLLGPEQMLRALRQMNSPKDQEKG